jgi:hypothetical protein
MPTTLLEHLRTIATAVRSGCTPSVELTAALHEAYVPADFDHRA